MNYLHKTFNMCSFSAFQLWHDIVLKPISKDFIQLIFLLYTHSAHEKAMAWHGMAWLSGNWYKRYKLKPWRIIVQAIMSYQRSGTEAKPLLISHSLPQADCLPKKLVCKVKKLCITENKISDNFITLTWKPWKNLFFNGNESSWRRWHNQNFKLGL